MGYLLQLCLIFLCHGCYSLCSLLRLQCNLRYALHLSLCIHYNLRSILHSYLGFLYLYINWRCSGLDHLLRLWCNLNSSSALFCASYASCACAPITYNTYAVVFCSSSFKRVACNKGRSLAAFASSTSIFTYIYVISACPNVISSWLKSESICSSVALTCVVVSMLLVPAHINSSMPLTKRLHPRLHFLVLQ